MSTIPPPVDQFRADRRTALQVALPASVLESPADLFRPIEEARADLLRATGRDTAPDAVTVAVYALESGPPPAADPRPSAAHTPGDETTPFLTSTGGILAGAPPTGGRWWTRAGTNMDWRGLARRIHPSIRAEPPPGCDAIARAALSNCLGNMISVMLVGSPAGSRRADGCQLWSPHVHHPADRLDAERGRAVSGHLPATQVRPRAPATPARTLDPSTWESQ